MQDNNVSIMGMQESRDRHSFTRMHNDRWWICASAANKHGHFGCRLWVDTHMIVAKAGEVCAAPTEQLMFPIHLEPRFILVRMQTAAGSAP